MTKEDLKSWRAQVYGADYGSRSRFHAAKALGVSVRTYERYEAGSQPIFTMLELACWALLIRKTGVAALDTGRSE